MTKCNHKSIPLSSSQRRIIDAKFTGGNVTSDGGILLLRAIDQKIEKNTFSNFYEISGLVILAFAPIQWNKYICCKDNYCPLEWILQSSCRMTVFFLN